MKKIYLLTYKGGQKKTYLSKSALYADNTPAEMGISRHTLELVDFTLEDYENEKIKIEMLYAKSKSEIIEDKQKHI